MHKRMQIAGGSCALWRFIWISFLALPLSLSGGIVNVHASSTGGVHEHILWENIRGHILYENTLYRRTHSLREHIR